ELVRDALANGQAVPKLAIDSGRVVAGLREASEALSKSEQELGTPEGLGQQLATIKARRAELELLMQLKASRNAIVSEIERLRERAALETAKNGASTASITKKIAELS